MPRDEKSGLRGRRGNAQADLSFHCPLAEFLNIVACIDKQWRRWSNAKADMGFALHKCPENPLFRDKTEYILMCSNKTRFQTSKWLMKGLLI